MPTLAAQLLRIADLDIITADTRAITDSVELDGLQREQVIVYATRLCADLHSLAQAMEEPEDEAELYRAVAAIWLELRFEWQRHNLVANYQTIRTGECPAALLARASAASYLLQRIEMLLARDHLNRLGDSAVDMLDTLRDDVERSRARAE
jgi:hypothetical protein